MTESIHVNFTDDEANSEARTYEVIPTGEYNVAITECEKKAVAKQGSVNFGKPFYNLKLVIQDGKYEGKWLFVSVMLFEMKQKKDPSKGSNFLLSQFLKALGVPVVSGQPTAIPSPTQLEGKKIVAVVAKVKDDYKSKEAGETVFKAEVKGFKTINGNIGSVSTPAQSAAASVLP